MPWARTSRGRNALFQPRLTLEHTGWSGSRRWQWSCEFLGNRGPASFGLGCSDEMTVERAWARFREHLLKFGYRPVNRGGAE
jgi:hypothetical protein